MEYNVRYWRKRKELLKTAKSGSRAFRGPKAGKSACFTRPDFSAAKLEKKVRKFARVNTVNYRRRGITQKHKKFKTRRNVEIRKNT
jgi:hypothetical protein